MIVPLVWRARSVCENWRGPAIGDGVHCQMIIPHTDPSVLVVKKKGCLLPVCACIRTISGDYRCFLQNFIFNGTGSVRRARLTFRRYSVHSMTTDSTDWHWCTVGSMAKKREGHSADSVIFLQRNCTWGNDDRSINFSFWMILFCKKCLWN